MKIILQKAYENGARPPLQDWDGNLPPDGYAWCADAFADVFYSTAPAGFVDITVGDDAVTAMTVNREALDAYIAGLPDEPQPIPEVDYDAVLLDHDYRLLCLETGLTL